MYCQQFQQCITSGLIGGLFVAIGVIIGSMKGCEAPVYKENRMKRLEKALELSDKYGVQINENGDLISKYRARDKVD